jgi:hypothetical protein
MKPRSLTPLCSILRSSSRSTAWWSPGTARTRCGARSQGPSGAAGIGLALLVREDRDQATVARVEVEVALRLVVEVGLLEDERHAERALPEVDRGLPAGSDDRDVVDALALEFSHLISVIDEFRLVFAAPQAPRRHE